MWKPNKSTTFRYQFSDVRTYGLFMINHQKLAVRSNRVKYFKQQLSLSLPSFPFFVLFSLLFPSKNSRYTTDNILTSSSDIKRTRLSQIFLHLLHLWNELTLLSQIILTAWSICRGYFERNKKHNLCNNLQVYRFLKPSRDIHQKLYMLYRLLLHHAINAAHKVHTLQKLDQCRIDFSSIELLILQL